MRKRISTKGSKKLIKPAKKMVVNRRVRRDAISVSGKFFSPNARLKDVWPRLEKHPQLVFENEDYSPDIVFQTEDGGYLVAELKSNRISSFLPSENSPRSSESFINQVIDYAAEVMGGREKAMLWLGSPVRGLDFATPVSLLGTKEGAERVKEILGQMEHGIW